MYYLYSISFHLDLSGNLFIHLFSTSLSSLYVVYLSHSLSCSTYLQPLLALLVTQYYCEYAFQINKWCCLGNHAIPEMTAILGYLRGTF